MNQKEMTFVKRLKYMDIFIQYWEEQSVPITVIINDNNHADLKAFVGIYGTMKSGDSTPTPNFISVFS